MNTPKVVFLSSGQSLWGAEHSLLSIAEGLAAQGVSVTIWAASDELLDRWGKDGRAIRLGDRTRVKNRRVLCLLREVPDGATLVSFDIALAPALALARPFLARRGITVAIDCHDLLRNTFRHRLILRAAQSIDVVVCVSQFIADQFPNKGVVVWRPIPTAAENETSVGFVVGIIGRIDGEKRVELALRACAKAASKPTVVLRGGTFTDGAEYLDAMVALGNELLGARFRYEGRVPHAVALHDVDILLHTNEFEPSGRVVAEAQAHGVVPIVPNAGGAPEFVESGKTGLVFTANDESSAADRIDALADRALRERISVAARDFAQTHYDVTDQSTAYARVLGINS